MAKAYVPKPCRRCGGPKSLSAEGRMRTWYCNSCWAAIVAENQRDRGACGKCDTPFCCPECRRIKAERNKSAAAKSLASRRRNQAGYFRPHDAERYWQSKAHATVKLAIGRGLLPSLKSGEFACADCGEPAAEYDHRDYARALDVEPVCRSCNKQRGTASWPTPDRFQFARLKAA